MATTSSMLASVAATVVPSVALTSTRVVADCSQKTNSSLLRSSFKGTKVAAGKGYNPGMVPAGRTGNYWLQSVRNGIMGGTQNGGSAPKDNEVRLGKSGKPLYTTLGGHPVSDDNNRYCLLPRNGKVMSECLLSRRGT